jgi:uncharacterized protein (DUF433 family)
MSKPADEAAAVSSPRHVLPKDLENAIKYLGDQELDRLFAAAFAEIRRRGRWPPGDKPPPEMASDLTTASLTRGQLNAVRAAFKAGITPTRIARQFGLSESDVRKALAPKTFGQRGID